MGLAVGQIEIGVPTILTLRDPGAPAPGEVRIRIRTVPIGIAEIRALSGDRIALAGQSVDKDHPFIFGFAAVGVVDACSDEQFQSGDRVVITPLDVCGTCTYCRNEDETQCITRRRLAGIDADSPGMMQDTLVVPARRVLNLPDSISDIQGCYISEVATAVHLCRRAGVAEGQKIAVVGAGRHGQLVISVAKAMGAGEIHAIDPSRTSLAAAQKAGASKTGTDLSTLHFADIAFHCNSDLRTIGTCCDLVAPGGTVGLLGTPTKEFPDAGIEQFLSRVVQPELRLVASASKGTASFRHAIDLMSSGKLVIDTADSLEIPPDQAPVQFRQVAADWPNAQPTFVTFTKGRP